MPGIGAPKMGGAGPARGTGRGSPVPWCMLGRGTPCGMPGTPPPCCCHMARAVARAPTGMTTTGTGAGAPGGMTGAMGTAMAGGSGTMTGTSAGITSDMLGGGINGGVTAAGVTNAGGRGPAGMPAPT